MRAESGRVGWLDATCGISGDMFLGACLDAGASLEAVETALHGLSLPEPISVVPRSDTRGGLRALRAEVRVSSARTIRHLEDVLGLLDAARLDEPVRTASARAFRALADAESRAHGVPIGEIHFHEVGALDSIADVVGGAAALLSLDLGRLVCSPIALGGGRARTDHGPIPVPGPAVLELLRAHAVPASGGPVEMELATPTGVALAATLADEFGPMPSMTVEGVGIGAGRRDPDNHPNITRLVVGRTDSRVAANSTEVVIETNVDDLDPRLWPAVLEEVLHAGASDAWLTPISMKKGRPAHTLSVLTTPGRRDAVLRTLFVHTSTIGVRSTTVEKTALVRRQAEVVVFGEKVGVKLAYLDGELVNASAEFDDVLALARRIDTAPATVMEAARAAAWALAEADDHWRD
jgi:uncharacterized protein (TIGR00299 family) protein